MCSFCRCSGAWRPPLLVCLRPLYTFGCVRYLRPPNVAHLPRRSTVHVHPLSSRRSQYVSPFSAARPLSSPASPYSFRPKAVVRRFQPYHCSHLFLLALSFGVSAVYASVRHFSQPGYIPLLMAGTCQCVSKPTLGGDSSTNQTFFCNASGCRPLEPLSTSHGSLSAVLTAFCHTLAGLSRVRAPS